MSSIYETIKFSSKTKMNLFVHSVNYVQNHWHESLEILFILKGNVNIVIDDTLYNLKQEDVIVINMNEIHTVSADGDNMILALQIPIDFIKYHYEDIENIKFCNSVFLEDENKDIVDEIRHILAKTMWTYSKDEEDCELKMQALVLELIYILCRNFKENNSLNNKNSNKYSERLKRIIEFIDKNYKEDITLSSLAEREYLSSAYLSKFFSKYMGKNFHGYLSSIKLEHAVKDLIYTDLSITEVALNNGFSNEKTFFNLFKNNIYQDCTIFISNSNLYMANLNPESSSILKSLEKENFIIVTTYITELCKFYNNNLDDAPYYLIKGINISHEDLSNVKLPNNKSFFQDLYFSNIFNCSLPPIDPSIYDLSNITFDSVSFHPDTMFSKLITSANFIYCEFPSLDFTSLDSDKKINLSYCKIGEGSTFPNDIDFFIRNNFHSCSLPNYDYSHYNLTNNFLTISAFSSESILPLERYGSKKFNIMNNMRYIPTRYLSEYIQLCTIPDPRIFLLKYYENLSEDDLFIFYQKYIL